MGDAGRTDSTTRLPAFGPTPAPQASGWAAQSAWQGRGGGHGAPGQPHGETPSQPGHASGPSGSHSGEMPRYGATGSGGYPSSHPGEALPAGTPYGQPGVPGAPGGTSKSRKLGLIAVSLGLVLLLALVVGGAVFLSSASLPGMGERFEVGSCIEEGTGEVIACDEKGAYEIVKKVKDPKKCPDLNAPTATVNESDEVLCLKKVA